MTERKKSSYKTKNISEYPSDQWFLLLIKAVNSLYRHRQNEIPCN